MRRPPSGWRVRLGAALALADEALSHVDAYLSALLDRRSLKNTAAAGAARLGAAWRRHRERARIRRYGPGRGLLAVVITRPHTPKEPHRER